VLHDRTHGLAGAKHAAIAGGVRHVHGQQRQPLAGTEFHQALQGGGGDQRHVAIQDQRDAVVGQHRRGLLYRVTGTELGLLADERHFGFVVRRRPTRHRSLDLLRSVAGNDDDAPNVQFRHAVNHMLQQWASAQTMQHFGQTTFHPRSLARGHDYHIDCCHALS
jgi:hypothetical protein